MIYADWAEGIAHSLLSATLPRRWAHTSGVAATARTLAPILGRDADLLIAAAWLHDIGYSPGLARARFHPLDGARYLRDHHDAPVLLCRLVAYHSCAMIEASERGLGAELAAEFEPPPGFLSDALVYCDMMTGPDGQRMAAGERLDEIRSRYGPGDVVTRSINRSAPLLTAACRRVSRRLPGPTAGLVLSLVPGLAVLVHPR